MAIKKTLLELTQRILSSMDSDEVNSISDTLEATQVAERVEETYENLIVELDLPKFNQVGQLTALGDTTKPNYMQLSDDVAAVQWIKYDKATASDTDVQLEEISYLSPTDFHNWTAKRNESSTNIMAVTDFNGTELLIYTDRAPQYWTSFDDEYIIFDAYDSDLESTLQQSKSAVYYTKFTGFTLSDTYTPDLPDKYFPLLLNEAKALCFAELKQTTNNRAERTARKQRAKLQKDKRRTGGDHAYNAYGRPGS